MQKQHTWGSKAVVFALLIGCLISAPVGSAAAPPDDCITYVYSVDESGMIYTLMQNDSIMFGNTGYLVSNCDQEVVVKSNGIVMAQINGSSWFPINMGFSTYTLEVNGSIIQVYDNVTIYSSEIWTDAFYSIEPNQDPDLKHISQEQLATREVMIALGSSVIVWCMVTLLLWKIINHNIDRKYVEEVIG
mgnify:CR=1 FL=1